MSELIVVMGVAGCGKSTIGRILAKEIHAPFVEGDEFHPPENIAKMSSGKALTDSDREIWIAQLASFLAAKTEPRLVVACSALTSFVRMRLLETVQRSIHWLLLDLDKAELRRRMERREHFMPPSLLDSQIAALTIPEGAIRLDASRPPAEVAAAGKKMLEERKK